MADVTPDYQVEIQRLKVQIADLEANVQRFRLSIMESESKKETAFRNIRATEEAIERTKENMNQLIETHGEKEITDS